MTYYAVSQIVKLIQDNLHDERYHDVSRFTIEGRLRTLIRELKPKRYPPINDRTKFSLDENFKNTALSTLTNFRRVKKPTATELKQEAYDRFIRDLAPIAIEDLQHKGLWFKLSKLYTALENRKVLPKDLTAQSFWNSVNPKLKDFDYVYIVKPYDYSKYPNIAVRHYKVEDLPAIMRRLIQEDTLDETLVPGYLLNTPLENDEEFN